MKPFQTHLGFTPEDPNQKALAELWEDWADESLYFMKSICVNDSEALEEAIRISSIGRPAYEKPMVKVLF